MLHASCFRKDESGLIVFSLAHQNYQSHETLISGAGKKSEHSDYESRRRAFQRGSIIIFLNQHILSTFLTLTYRNQHSDYQQILNDLKNVFSRRKISYLAVVEKHKSGFYHIHAITSDLPNVVSLRRGKYSWACWKKGFSDVKFVKDTDEKFRIEKYIFKYMNKADKIGGRYFLKSRDLTLLRDDSELNRIQTSLRLDSVECRNYNVGEYKLYCERRFYNGKKTIEKSQT